ncbi:hypothetical protein GW17_00025302 [Ensete ventricosum]|nr:hypothetical protein GW17_00025302 [Ensete ventricosum]
MASRGVTLVLCALWFNRSSWIRAKEIAAIRVYGCRALTSPRIFDFRSSMKVPKSCFLDQSSVWLDKCSNLVCRMGILEKRWPVGRWIGLGGSRLRFRADLGGCLDFATFDQKVARRKERSCHITESTEAI